MQIEIDFNKTKITLPIQESIILNDLSSIYI